jgi:hypothetical protein
MIPEEPLSSFKVNYRSLSLVRLPGAPQGAVQHNQYRVDRGQDMGFRAPERREAYPREPELQRS